ncbi:MAG TPA: D-glycero-beta-D-manno-heptose-7-phosphate kinase [Bryobacteraceae bacterium]|jgi:D-beta-D-heptose 7-phosphate kinase/D-beta-D-heptose 1-phosphate adenosyltransferase|nr:D-glycero-beta-D-manno-heptose-7-phosphate kinase [Bryobacteraceae bacterium]
MIEHLDRVVDLVELHWPAKRLLVVGDIMLDKYVWGRVERVSPEAPVPIVRATHNSEQPGGAANVAMNLAGLGASVKVVGFAGEDADRMRVEALLTAAGVESAIISVAGFPTISKMRILGGQQQMLRLDIEKNEAPPAAAYDSLLQVVLDHLPSSSAVILSDYAKGVLTPSVCQQIIRAARSQNIPVLVDPKSADFSRYRGATTICPNLPELANALRATSNEPEALLAAGQRMVPELDVAYLVVTLSEKGIAVVKETSYRVAPAAARQVFDVSGAGDTVISVLALSAACGLPVEDAVQLANVAAGVVVGKVGTVPIQKFELISALSGELAVHAEEKILSLDRLFGRVAAWRLSGQKIVFTNGCFDLLHIGHITVLERARQEGDRLIVALNGDQSVALLKGPGRPLVHQRDRAQILAALAAVDAVVIFDEQTPLAIIEAIRPDVIVKGGDYTENEVVGAPQVRSWGGRVKIVPLVKGFSTTGLIDKSAALP